MEMARESLVKYCLIRCPQTNEKYISAAYAVPPIGLAYVAASLVEAGHDVQIIDPTGEAIDQFAPLDGDLLRRGLSDDEILERIRCIDVIGFSLMFSQDWLPARTLIEKVRARFPGAVTVAGGEHFTAEPEGALREAPGLDYVLAGEGDRVICDLAEYLDGTRRLEDVPGVHHRAADGTIQQTSAPVRVRDIDDIPWPAWNLVPIENYLAGGHGWGVDRGRNMPINATRGCPYQCTFCSSPKMWTTRWVARSPQDVVAEIKHYVAEYGATNFDFHDLTAIIKKDWVLEFTRLLIDERLGVTWQLPTGTRSEALDHEVMPLLVASGCTNITYAPESGTDEILKRVKKKIRRGRMVDSVRFAVKAGCNVKANFIFGLPDDTYRLYWQTFGFLAQMAVAGVHDISIAPFRPYPGSELFREMQERGILPKPLDDTYYHDLARVSETVPGTAQVKARSYCEHMSPKGLDRLRVSALAWFFLISWAIRPIRILRTLRAVVTERQESRLDKSLIEMKRRLRKVWGGKPDLQVGEINPY
jgi:radical SAM superfamily enzyme YgiQ (UPF0313 family)